jgi:hypothetical protein
MKVTTNIDLDRSEEEALDRDGVCPLCGHFLKKHEGQNAWENFVMTDDGWKSTVRDVNEVDHMDYSCTNNKCSFQYDHPC